MCVRAFVKIDMFALQCMTGEHFKQIHYDEESSCVKHFEEFDLLFPWTHTLGFETSLPQPEMNSRKSLTHTHTHPHYFLSFTVPGIAQLLASGMLVIAAFCDDDLSPSTVKYSAGVIARVAVGRHAIPKRHG